MKILVKYHSDVISSFDSSLDLTRQIAMTNQNHNK